MQYPECPVPVSIFPVDPTVTQSPEYQSGKFPQNRWNMEHHTPNAPNKHYRRGSEKRLIQLNPHKAAGPDRITPLVLKELADVIAPVITRLIYIILYYIYNIFQKAIPPYQDALKKSGCNYKLEYKPTPTDNNNQNNKQKNKRKMQTN